MRVAIYQPRYFPQLHYFNRMITSDCFVLLGLAQYTKALSQEEGGEKKRCKSYQSDTPVKAPSGTILLTVPLKHDGISMIDDTQIDYQQHWQKKHLQIIKYAYKKALFFKPIYPQIKKLLMKEYQSLGHLNTTTILWSLLFLFGEIPKDTDISLEYLNRVLEKQKSIPLKTVYDSQTLGVPRPEGLQKGTEWTTAICKKLGATEYLHGKTALMTYMNLDYYKAHRITPVCQNWDCKRYPQQFPRVGFLHNLSILDLVFNLSPKEARKVIGVNV